MAFGFGLSADVDYPLIIFTKMNSAQLASDGRWLASLGDMGSLGTTDPRCGTPYGIRTRVTGVKGRRPRPLDERGPTREPADRQHRPFDPGACAHKRASKYGSAVAKGTNPARGVTMRLMAAASGGYLLGMIPSADIAARVARRSDLRLSGTGNPGGMNASHVLGKSWGAGVSVADIAKGVAAARLGRALAGDAGANLASTAAVGGHCFPLGRTGGKGVATSIGQVIGTFPVYLPLDAAVALATSVMPLKQRTRTATTVASITWVATAAHWWWHGWRNPGGVMPTVSLPLAAAASSAIIALRFAAGAETVDAFNRPESPEPVRSALVAQPVQSAQSTQGPSRSSRINRLGLFSRINMLPVGQNRREGRDG